ncbi:MAG: hypothetical protein ABSG97_04625 [Sedimentisphaerales bacterium]|jgi:hypothetical protein
MKKLLLIAVVLFGMVAPVLAQEGDLHGDIGYTYDTMHVWRGYLTWGHHSGSNPFIDLDLYGTGFGIEAIGHYANGSGSNPDGLGYDHEQRWDYSVYYKGALEPEETYATMYKVGYRYFNYPEMSSHGENSIDLQELYAGVQFPKLLGVKGLVPGYVVVKGWPSNSDTLVGARNPNGGTYSGWAHIFMLDYALPLENVSSEIPKQDLNFHIETVYNCGVDPRPGGGYTDHDWTHVMMGVSTDFDLGNNLIFTPGLYHQITMEDDPVTGVSPDHSMTWGEFTIKYKF